MTVNCKELSKLQQNMRNHRDIINLINVLGRWSILSSSAYQFIHFACDALFFHFVKIFAVK